MTIRLQSIRPNRLKMIDTNSMSMNVSHDIEAYLNTVRKQMQSDYGRVPPSPKYQRTNTLRDGWVVTMHGPYEGTLTNDTEYAVYVQGTRRHGDRNELGQTQAAWARRRGWRSITDVAAQYKKPYVLAVNKSMKSGSAIED